MYKSLTVPLQGDNKEKLVIVFLLWDMGDTNLYHFFRLVIIMGRHQADYVVVNDPHAFKMSKFSGGRRLYKRYRERPKGNEILFYRRSGCEGTTFLLDQCQPVQVRLWLGSFLPKRQSFVIEKFYWFEFELNNSKLFTATCSGDFLLGFCLAVERPLPPSADHWSVSVESLGSVWACAPPILARRWARPLVPLQVKALYSESHGASDNRNETLTWAFVAYRCGFWVNR